MIRHIRTATLAVTLSAVAASTLSTGVPANALPLHARTKATVHHRRSHTHKRRRPHERLFGVTPRMMAAAARVSRCEEGGNWHFAGSTFDGGIGWTPENWAQFRKPTWPRHMHSAPPHMQANALFRFVWHYGIALPDQNGSCAGY